MNNFKDKVVVITGGTTGIGFSFSKQFGKEGAKIVICARRINKVNEAVEELRSMGIEASGTHCDVSVFAEVEALANFAWNKYGQVDVVMNNAGVAPAMTSIIDSDPKQVMNALQINLLGVWNVVSVFGKRLRDQGTPCAIYNMGSENSLFNGVPLGGDYVVSKHGVLGLTDVLRKEVPDFMKVGLICPGLVNSELGEGGIDFGMDTDKFTSIAMEQIKAGKFYIVSHGYNMVRIEAKYNEIRSAYDQYAPRYENDVEFDVKTIMGEFGME